MIILSVHMKLEEMKDKQDNIKVALKCDVRFDFFSVKQSHFVYNNQGDWWCCLKTISEYTGAILQPNPNLLLRYYNVIKDSNF